MRGSLERRLLRNTSAPIRLATSRLDTDVRTEARSTRSLISSLMKLDLGPTLLPSRSYSRPRAVYFEATSWYFDEIGVEVGVDHQDAAEVAVSSRSRLGSASRTVPCLQGAFGDLVSADVRNEGAPAETDGEAGVPEVV